ncbi:MAG TPA: hypothetical protein VKM55_00845 [Candidatus Lokiarchaeia archaeon]|nr:hypothetical protein [Candidatus Lokiarchaeia archaeon]
MECSNCGHDVLACTACTWVSTSDKEGTTKRFYVLDTANIYRKCCQCGNLEK